MSKGIVELAKTLEVYGAVVQEIKGTPRENLPAHALEHIDMAPERGV